jgi:GntR family transcriptional regulator
VTNDDRPVYLRLRDSIAAKILDGSVGDGDPLPSVRSLAAEYGANPLTVAKAYQTFQDEGLIVVKRGVGMFVAAGASERLRASARKEFLEQRWPAIAAHIRRLDLDVEDLVERALA